MTVKHLKASVAFDKELGQDSRDSETFEVASDGSGLSAWAAVQQRRHQGLSLCTAGFRKQAAGC